jgi:predicted aconitase
MADYELRYRKRPGPVSRILGSIGGSALLQSLGDQELDAPEPKVVWHTGRSAALRDLAFELTGAGVDDQVAVGALTRAAGRHTKELRRAAATIRAEGLAGEDEAGCRADRLLVAAATGRAVEPLTAEEAAWFARVRALSALATAEGFAELAVEEPDLAVLADEVLRVARAASTDARGDGSPAEAPADVVDAVHTGLAAVSARTSSRMVRTRAARRIARDHLWSVAGLPVVGVVLQEADEGQEPGRGVPPET